MRAKRSVFGSRTSRCMARRSRSTCAMLFSQAAASGGADRLSFAFRRAVAELALGVPAPTVDRAIAGDPATVVVTRADHRELEISLHRRWLGVPLSGRQETPPRAEPSLEVVAPAVRFATRRHAARVHPARAQGPECHPSVDRRGRGLMLLALQALTHRRADPEPAVLEIAPAIGGRVRGDRTRVLSAGHHRPEPDLAGDRPRALAPLERVVAELVVFVQPPAVHDAAHRHPARMVQSGGHGGEAQSAADRDRDGRRGRRGVAAEYPRAVVAPAVGIPASGEPAGVYRAAAECCEMMAAGHRPGVQTARERLLRLLAVGAAVAQRVGTDLPLPVPAPTVGGAVSGEAAGVEPSGGHGHEAIAAGYLHRDG